MGQSISIKEVRISIKEVLNITQYNGQVVLLISRMFVKVYFTVLHIVYVQINVREHQGAIKNGQTRKIKTKTQHNNSIPTRIYQ